MKLRYAAPLLAALALSAPAFAQDAQAPHDMSQNDMARHHGQMCTNHYARAVGGLAALEVELKLTSAQKPLFERWKNVKLANAKSVSAKCTEMKMPDHQLSIIEARKLQIALLETRLADLKAETPALEALVNSLDNDQQETLKRAGIFAMHHRMEMAERFMDHRMMMRHHGEHDMPMPPPPPAN